MKSLFLVLVANILIAKVPITSSFEKGQAMARAYDKPMVVLFTGSDWSEESQRLMEELQAQELGNQYLFVQLDFPENGRSKEIEKAFALKERFGVEVFPTAVLITPMGEEVTRFGRLGTSYAAHVRKALHSFDQLEQADFFAASDDELIEYYKEATKLGNHSFIQAILHVAEEQKRCPDLLIERYCQTGDEALKEAIIALDPDSERMSRL